MTPVLIDTRSWLKFGFIAVFFSSVIFSAGFIFGYKNAATYYQPLSEASSPLIKEKNVAVSDAGEPVTAETITEPANMDGVQEDHTIMRGSVESKLQANNAGPKKVEVYEGETDLREIPVASTIVDDVPQTNLAESWQSENTATVKFSIQAGLYGSLSNAEKAAMQLQAENYDAYVSEYVNKKNQVRYNVRIGYFVDKQSALPTLYAIRKKKKSDAYLVQFSAEATTVLVDDGSL